MPHISNINGSTNHKGRDHRDADLHHHRLNIPPPSNNFEGLVKVFNNLAYSVVLMTLSIFHFGECLTPFYSTWSSVTTTTKNFLVFGPRRCSLHKFTKLLTGLFYKEAVAMSFTVDLAWPLRRSSTKSSRSSSGPLNTCIPAFTDLIHSSVVMSPGFVGKPLNSETEILLDLRSGSAVPVAFNMPSRILFFHLLIWESLCTGAEAVLKAKLSTVRHAKHKFRISNCHALLAKYDFNNYAKLPEFPDDLPQDKQQHFQALVEEDCQTMKLSFQAAVHAADTSSRSVAISVIMRQQSWLQFSGLPSQSSTSL
ncbi:hypothetical protein KIL84_004560 [Mauremys mutica]|uniref:Uncharacterized protein n=1 Tax=Mauremys mutica TaxID=74926 RepID=A0A9D3XPM1_9SAUR|nr:hypothetical protein KIL84_004560 [Mauremys mutica]